MARIQILELPEGAGDERPPFVLVVDEYLPQRYILGPGVAQPEQLNPFEGVAEQVGARSVLVFEETIEIPANEVTLEDGKSYPVTIKVEGDFETFRAQLEDEVRSAQARLNQARPV